MAKKNLTTGADVTIRAREVDFVTSFGKNWKALQDILGITRPVKKALGTQLVTYKASVTLEDGEVGEGENIPYSKASIVAVPYGDITLEKYAKAVSIEAVNKYGATVAVEKTDDAFKNELQTKVMNKFYTFLKTGTLKTNVDSFQMAIATAIGSVVNKFQSMDRDCSEVAVWVNTMDAYTYLGASNLTIQNLFGMQYIENFMGAKICFLSAKVPEKTVIATPLSNIIMYYVDPSDADFSKLGLEYTVAGDTNLIGFHANGNYGTAVGESFALMGITLLAEYLDGISVVTIGKGA